MTRHPYHSPWCHCGECTPRSPADRTDTVIRARLIVAAIGAALVLLVGIIIDFGRVS